MMTIVPRIVIATAVAALCLSCSPSPSPNIVGGPWADPALGVVAAKTSRGDYPTVGLNALPTMLPEYRGPLVISQPGTVIENVQIVAPQVRVRADNVTFRNVRFIYSGRSDEKFAMVTIDSRYRGTILENCEIDGRNGTARGVAGTSGVTVRRCNIHNVGNGVEVQSDFIVDRSYIHDIFTPPGLSWHADGVQSGSASPANIRVTNNTVLLAGSETGAINIVATEGVARNIVVANNLVGGGGWTLYSRAVRADTFVVANNAFTSEIFPKVGRYGPWYPDAKNVEAYGNFILGTGAPVTPPAQ